MQHNVRFGGGLTLDKRQISSVAAVSLRGPVLMITMANRNDFFIKSLELSRYFAASHNKLLKALESHGSSDCAGKWTRIGLREYEEICKTPTQEVIVCVRCQKEAYRENAVGYHTCNCGPFCSSKCGDSHRCTV